MKKLSLLILASVLVFLLLGCPPPVPTGQDVVTGVTITGPGVTGTGASKEVTINKGTPVDLNVDVTYSGSPDLTESWVSADAAIVAVVQDTGIVNGLEVNSAGVQVTVTVGGKSDSILVRVGEVVGAVLTFDTDKLEWYSLATTNPFTPGSPVTPTVVKNGDVITASNTDGTFKESETLQGSSYLLLKTPITGNFEVKAAVKVILATAGSDKYSCGVGMFVPDGGSGLVYLDSAVAVMAKRSKSTPDMRSLYSKSNSPTGDIGAGSPYITPCTLTDYHILSVKRVGGNVTFSVNEDTAVVNIDSGGTTTGMLEILGGSVKVGMYFAGVTAQIEGFTINSLDGSGDFVEELYSSGAMPAIPVSSIDVHGPGGVADQSASIDMTGLPSTTLQLATTYSPSYASVGTTITYSVQDAADTNVSVDGSTGLVTITGAGDGSATIVATSDNGVTDTYVISLVDANIAVTSVTIPSTANIYEGQTLTLSPVTVLPASVLDKSVTWASDTPGVIDVNATTGEITVATGTVVGTTANITATSVHTSSVTSNACVVTVVIQAGTPKVYTFPTTNWWTGANQATFLASATIPAEGSTTNFNALTTPTLNSLDGLYYKSNSAGSLRLRYSAVNGNAVNYNGSTLPSASPTLPADGGTVDVSTYTRYISVPLSGVTTANVQIDVTLVSTTSGSGSATMKFGVVGTDGMTSVLESTITVDTTTAGGGPSYTYTWSGAKGTMTNLILIFSREGGSGGGVDIRSITITPQS